MNPIFTIDRLRKLSVPLAILFLLAFCTKACLNAFASNAEATASLVQYSALATCLLITLASVSYNLMEAGTDDPRKNANIYLFMLGITWVLGNVIAFIALNGDNLALLNRGHLTPSINTPLNTFWIIVPQFMLILYNLKIFIDCDTAAPCNKISWITLVILAFAFIQTYFIVDSSRVIQHWPTDDALKNIPRIKMSV
jgi:hypothetical protein